MYYFKSADIKDCDLIFSWANDEQVRKNSFNQQKIQYSEHRVWFENKLSADNYYMYIFCEKDTSCGQVRLEVSENVGIISYSISEEHRGRGIASKMLSLFEVKVKDEKININKLVGYVKFENIASQRVFEKLNYEKVIEEKRIKYYKGL